MEMESTGVLVSFIHLILTLTCKIPRRMQSGVPLSATFEKKWDPPLKGGWFSRALIIEEIEIYTHFGSSLCPILPIPL